MTDRLLKSTGRKRITIFLTAAILVAAVTTLNSEGIPAVINYQGRLLDSYGNPQPDGPYTMTFYMYAEATGSKGVNALWGPETHEGVAVKDSYFSVLLGDPSKVPFSQDLFETNPELYLGISVGEGDPPEMAPRQRIVSVPFAQHSGSSDTASHATTADAADTVDGYHAEDIPSILGLGVYDYGTSASSYSLKSSADLKICYGVITVAGSQTITNLPFTSADSYRVITVQNGTSDNFPASVVNNSGSQFTLYKTNSHSYHWIAIGT